MVASVRLVLAVGGGGVSGGLLASLTWADLDACVGQLGLPWLRALPGACSWGGWLAGLGSGLLAFALRCPGGVSLACALRAVAPWLVPFVGCAASGASAWLALCFTGV